MSQSSTIANQLRAREIDPREWNPFLAEFTREFRGAHARLEVVGPNTDIGSQVETEGRPFEGVSADTKDREREVWISFGTSAGSHLSHGIQQAKVIRMLPPSKARGAVLEIESVDGTKNILELSHAEEYALPPAQ